MMGSLFYMLILSPLILLFIILLTFCSKCDNCCSKKCGNWAKKKFSNYDREFFIEFYESWFLPLNVMATINAHRVITDGLHTNVMIITVSNYFSILLVVIMPLSIIFITLPLLCRNKPDRFTLQEAQINIAAML